MEQTVAVADYGLGGDLASAVQRWWLHLGEFERYSARRAAWCDDDLSPALFRGLFEENLIVVRSDELARFEGGCVPVPMPRGLRVCLVALTARRKP